MNHSATDRFGMTTIVGIVYKAAVHEIYQQGVAQLS